MDFLNDDDETDNVSSFPLFNFAALSSSFQAEMPKTFISEDDLKILDLPVSKRRHSNTDTKKKPKGRRKSKQKSLDVLESKVTLKDIIEDDKTGEPMPSDVKMMEQRLKKMREGKARKQQERINRNLDSERNDNSKNTTNENHSGNEIVTGPYNFEIQLKDGNPVVVNKQDSQDNKPKLVQANRPTKLTSMSFRPKNHTKQWTDEETRKFYKSIELFGSDFSMIAKLFPTRNRKQVKNKLHREEKNNPVKIEELFKKHRSQNRIASHMKKLNQIENTEGQNSQLLIENLNFLNFDRNSGRKFSNCSLDSMDNGIVQDLKNILTSEAPLFRDFSSTMPKSILKTPIDDLDEKEPSKEIIKEMAIENVLEATEDSKEQNNSIYDHLHPFSFNKNINISKDNLLSKITKQG